jgi:hypothetical protein
MNTGQWARERAQRESTPQDPRLARIHAIYGTDFGADDLVSGWAFYLDAHRKAGNGPVSTTDEMALTLSFQGIVALAARTRLGLATALAVATWHLSERRRDERPNL